MALFPRRRSGPAAEAAREISIATPGQVAAAVRGASDAHHEGAPVLIRASHLGVLRALSLVADGALRSTSIDVVVEQWTAPRAGWRGSAGPLPGLRELSCSWAGDGGEVVIRVRVDEPVDVAQVARALVPLLTPVRAEPAPGSPRVVAGVGVPASALAYTAGPFVPRASDDLDPGVLSGNDIVLAGGAESVALGGQVVSVDARGRLAGATGPAIDIRVHNPLGRLRSWSRGTSAALRTVDARGEIVGIKSEQTIALLDLETPLDDAQVAALAKVSRLDLSGAHLPEGEARRAGLEGRLAELAAIGLELHSGAALAERLVDLDPTVRRLMSELPTAGPGLERAHRLAVQRRAAMRGHMGDELVRRATGAESALPTVTALLVSRRPEAVPAMLAQLRRQTYPRLEVVVAIHGAGPLDLGSVPPETRQLVSDVLTCDADVVFGEVLARATAAASGTLVTKIDDDDFYGPEHVWDLVLARRFSGAQVVGKRPEYVYLEAAGCTVHRKFASETYNLFVAGGTMLLSKADLEAVGGWRPVPRSVDRAVLARVEEAGGLVYATHGLGYLYVRHGRGHTWVADDDRFLKEPLERWEGRHDAVLELS